MKKIQKLKCLFLFLCSICIGRTSYSQHTYSQAEAMQVLRSVSVKLNSLSTVAYKFTREALYSGENYHHIYNTEVFIDFTSKNNNAGFTFQADDDNYFSCYNGSQYFGLNKTEKTISIKKKPAKEDFENLSPIYNSLISLRAILPLLIKSDSIQMTVMDTTIGKENFYTIKFELYNKYFGNLGGLNNFTAQYIGDKNKPYEIIVYKNSFLPYQYITKFKDRKADFIAATFHDIDISPKAPEEFSWFYSTYINEYSAPKSRQPLVNLGSKPEGWTLPSFSPEKIDSVSLSQYNGKIVMLDFWIKSCGPCLASFPHLNELQKKFGADKFQLLSINTEDTKDDIAFFYKKHKPVYKMLFGGEGLAEKYGVPFFPTIIIFDRSGKTIYAGGFDQQVIEKLIEKNL